MSGPGAPPAIRHRLGLALDLSDLGAAVDLARLLAPWFRVAKVGPELFISAGPDAVRALVGEGFDVFLDLKLHDIPTTVGRGAERAGALGAIYLTVHAAGGEAMVRAAVEGFRNGRDSARSGAAGNGWAGGMGSAGNAGEMGGAGVLGVTVLTSETEAPPETLRARAAIAAATGCVGAVCAAGDLAVVRESVPDLLAVVPGIRLRGASPDDQGRAATPEQAASAGAGLLVLGRTVTGVTDPVAAAQRVADEVEAGLAKPAG